MSSPPKPGVEAHTTNTELRRVGKCVFLQAGEPMANGCAEGDRLCTLMLTSENTHAGVAVCLVYR